MGGTIFLSKREHYDSYQPLEKENRDKSKRNLPYRKYAWGRLQNDNPKSIKLKKGFARYNK